MRALKSQSALEYLMTYSWALLIIGLVIVALFALGVLNPFKFVGTQCILPSSFSCTNEYMVSNGVISVNLQQVTSTPINLTAYGCNKNDTIAHMQAPPTPSTQYNLQIGGNYTFTVQCWMGNTKFSANPGQVFSGYLIINYTEVSTGFPHTVPGQLSVQIV